SHLRRRKAQALYPARPRLLTPTRSRHSENRFNGGGATQVSGFSRFARALAVFLRVLRWDLGDGVGTGRIDAPGAGSDTILHRAGELLGRSDDLHENDAGLAGLDGAGMDSGDCQG